MKLFVIVLLLILAFWIVGPAFWMLKFLITRFLAAIGLCAVAWCVYYFESKEGHRW